jgi:hypothetical protein
VEILLETNEKNKKIQEIEMTLIRYPGRKKWLDDRRIDGKIYQPHLYGSKKFLKRWGEVKRAEGYLYQIKKVGKYWVGYIRRK